jgi:hypothetical protein
MKDNCKLVVWQCSKCQRTMTGFLEQRADTKRMCGSNYIKGRLRYPLRVMRNGDIVPYVCKGEMIVKYDERPKVRA